MVQALDLTIVAGTLPFIDSDTVLHLLPTFSAYSPNIIQDQLAQLNWIISAFNLTATKFIPAWANLLTSLAVMQFSKQLQYSL